MKREGEEAFAGGIREREGKEGVNTQCCATKGVGNGPFSSYTYPYTLLFFSLLRGGDKEVLFFPSSSSTLPLSNEVVVLLHARVMPPPGISSSSSSSGSHRILKENRVKIVFSCY